MASVKWIKLSTDLFNNRKIKQIRKMPEGDAVIGIWLQLMCLAGDVNNGGLIYFSKDIPYTDEMLANEFDRPVNLIRLALKTFETFEMVYLTDNIICVSNWEKYQSQDKLEALREYNREKKRESRQRQKEREMSLTCQGSQDTDIYLISKSISKSNKKEGKKKPDIFEDVPENLLEPIKEFAKFRKELKKPMTKRAITLLLGRLQRLAGDDIEEYKKILDQSIMNGWTSIYPFKKDRTKETVNPFDELLRKELENEQNRNNSLDEDNKRLLPDVLQGE